MKQIKIILQAADSTFLLTALDTQSVIIATSCGSIFEDVWQIILNKIGMSSQELMIKCSFSLADETNDVLMDKAIRVLLEKHKGQVDKAGADYRLHPLRVAAGVEDVNAKVVALLHDVIEDTGTTPEDLANMGLPQNIIDGILSVTKRDGESYKDFVIRASRNKLGHQVKVADIKDNMNLFRLKKIEAEDAVRLNKYLQCYRFLTTGETKYLNLIED